MQLRKTTYGAILLVPWYGMSRVSELKSSTPKIVPQILTTLQELLLVFGTALILRWFGLSFGSIGLIALLLAALLASDWALIHVIGASVSVDRQLEGKKLRLPSTVTLGITILIVIPLIVVTDIGSSSGLLFSGVLIAATSTSLFLSKK